jgi:hypothetical protein
MISMTWIAEFIRGAVWIYLAVWSGATIAAWMVPKTLARRAVAMLLVTVAFGVLPSYLALSVKQEKAEQRPIVEQRKAQYEAAMARFEERCKTAGERVYRTVEDVEGVLLLKVRPETKPGDKSDPNWPDAALPNEGRADWYIRKFLLWEQRDAGDSSRGYLNEMPSPMPGYRFAEVAQVDGSFLRYRVQKPGDAELTHEKVSAPRARYAVSFANVVDAEDRKLWVAGTKVTVTDMATSEVLAEKTWYAVEPGQGSTASARSPWLRSQICPATIGWVERAPTRFFVDQILKPKKGE